MSASATRRLRFLTERGRRWGAEVREDSAVVPFLPMEAVGEHGELRTTEVRLRDELRPGHPVVHEGDVVIARITPCFENGKGALVRDLPGPAFGSTELLVLTPSERLDPRYLYYVTVSHPFRKRGEAHMTGVAGQQRVSECFVRDYPIPALPLERQRAIADRLDERTGCIDALLAAQKRLLELAEQRRQAVVTEAVTGADRRRGAGRRCRVPWLPRIPDHWRDARLRFALEGIEQGWSPRARARAPTDQEWGVLKVGAVHRSWFDASAAKALPANVSPRPALEIRAGDLLLTRANTRGRVGRVCRVEHTRPRLMLCDLVFRLHVREDLLDGGYLAYFLGTPLGRAQIEADARGTSGSMVKVSREHVRDWWVPLPPLAEQRGIVDALAGPLRRLVELEESTRRSIALLHERRAALIAEAVSGESPT